MSEELEHAASRRDRKLAVRAVHRDEPDLRRIAELMIRLALEDAGRTRVDVRARIKPPTLRPIRAAS